MNKDNRWWLLFGTFIFLLALFPVTSSDIWWHLKAGKDIWQAGLIFTEKYSYPTEGQAWLNVHWLFQLIVYQLYSIGGLALLAIAKAFTFVLSWVIIGKAFSIKNIVNFGILSTIAFFPLRFLILSRPIIPALLILSLMLYFINQILQKENFHFRTSWKKMGVIFLLQILWANIQGTFILGPIFVLLTLAAFKWQNISKHSLSWYRLITFPFGLYLINIINPHGWLLLKYPFDLWKRVASGQGMYSTFITENRPMWTIWEQGEYAIPMVVVGFTLLILTLLLKKNFTNKKMLLLYAVPMLYLGWTSERNALLLVFVILPLMFQNIRLTKILQGILFFVIGFAISLHSLSWWNKASLTKVSPYRFTAETTTQYLHELPANTRIFNADQFGGYILFNTSLQVFMDGRFITRTPEFFLEYLKVLQNPEKIHTLQQKWNFQYLVLPVSNQKAFNRIHKFVINSQNWTLKSQDSGAMIFQYRSK